MILNTTENLSIGENIHLVCLLGFISRHWSRIKRLVRHKSSAVRCKKKFIKKIKKLKHNFENMQ